MSANSNHKKLKNEQELLQKKPVKQFLGNQSLDPKPSYEN